MVVVPLLVTALNIITMWGLQLVRFAQTYVAPVNGMQIDALAVMIIRTGNYHFYTLVSASLITMIKLDQFHVLFVLINARNVLISQTSALLVLPTASLMLTHVAVLTGDTKILQKVVKAVPPYA